MTVGTAPSMEFVYQETVVSLIVLDRNVVVMGAMASVAFAATERSVTLRPYCV